MAESEEELKSLLMKVKEERGKVDLKFNIQKTKIMALGPMTSWQVGGETVKTVADFILGGSQITADGDYSHEMKRRLLLGRKVMTNLDNIFKSRDITLPTKVCLVKAIERLLLNHEKMPGFLASRGEEFSPGPDIRLDCSKLLGNSFMKV